MKRGPLDLRRRNVSRIALYGSLALALTVAGGLIELVARPQNRGIREDWHRVDWASLPEVQLLQDYVRIDTSNKTGSVLAGAEFLAELFAKHGITAHIERLGEKDANLWAILEGEDRKALVLHNHMDVEDIYFPERWGAFPPFEARIRLPWLYGRGSYDMKSVAIAQALALIDLKNSGAKLKKSVIFLGTTGEETGSDLGTQWILAHHPELVERFDVVLTEGGVLEGRSAEDLKYWGTEFAQKKYVDYQICDSSKERLEALRSDIQEYGRPEMDELTLSPEVLSFLPVYAPSRDRLDFQEIMADPASLARDRDRFQLMPQYVQAMVRPEFHALQLLELPGGGWEMRAKLHLPPGMSVEDGRRAAAPDWLLHGYSYTIYVEPSADHGSPVDHPVLAAITVAVHESYADVPIGPIFLPWTATDSRFFRQKGIPAYGFSPFLVLTTDALQVLGHFERIALPGYVEGVKIYSRLVRGFAA